MIPAIAVMIGFYIITRMVEILQKAEAKTSLKVFSLITIIVVILSMLAVMGSGSRSL